MRRVFFSILKQFYLEMWKTISGEANNNNKKKYHDEDDENRRKMQVKRGVWCV